MRWLSLRRSRWIWKWSKTESGCKSYDKFRDAHGDTRLNNGLKPNYDDFKWKKFQHESCASRRRGRFWYKHRPNPSSYAKVTAIWMQPCHGDISGAPHQPCVWWVARITTCFAWPFWPRRWVQIEKRSTWKFFVSSKRSIFFGHIFIRDHLLPQKPCRGKLAAVNSNLAGKSLLPWTVTLRGKACRREE